jgi:DNA-directed RNA polymerase specialized sigma24 family protein
LIPCGDISEFADLNEDNIQRFLSYKLVSNRMDREDIRQEYLIELLQQPAALTKSGSYLTTILDRTKVHYFRQQTHAWATTGPLWPLNEDNIGYEGEDGNRNPCLSDSTRYIDNAIMINDFQGYLERMSVRSHRQKQGATKTALAEFFRLKAGKSCTGNAYRTLQKWRNKYQKLD